MVPNTSDDLPEPETPVNTVSRRLGSSTLTSLRLFSRAPWTRIRSWLSAACRLVEAMRASLLGAGEVLGDQIRRRVDDPLRGRATVGPDAVLVAVSVGVDPEQLPLSRQQPAARGPDQGVQVRVVDEVVARPLEPALGDHLRQAARVLDDRQPLVDLRGQLQWL